MIAAKPGDPLLAIDDRALMVNWWQLSALSASNQPPMTLKAKTGGEGVHVDPPDKGSSGGVGILTGPTFPPFTLEVGPPHDGPFPHTNFYEHYSFIGDRLELSEGQIYHDLTEESSGFLGLGSDWNDRISSVQLVATTKAVLWEHVNEGGSSLTVTQNMASLPGWNDRASSCWTQ